MVFTLLFILENKSINPNFYFTSFLSTHIHHQYACPYRVKMMDTFCLPPLLLGFCPQVWICQSWREYEVENDLCGPKKCKSCADSLKKMRPTIKNYGSHLKNPLFCDGSLYFFEKDAWNLHVLNLHLALFVWDIPPVASGKKHKRESY